MKTQLKYIMYSGVILMCSTVKAQSQSWEITGNNNTNPTTNYLGTSTGSDFQIKTNATTAMYFTKDQLIGVGTTSPLLTTRMLVMGLGSSNTTASFQAGPLSGQPLFSITDGGRVGIGNFSTLSSISAQLHIQHSSNASVMISNGTSSVPNLTLRSNGTTSSIDANGGNLQINYLNPLAKLGIGVVPEAKLHIFGGDYENPITNLEQFIVGMQSRIFIVPELGGNAYNPLTQAGDIGFFFRNGNQNSGGAGLVIAPHSSFDFGIRIAPDGKVGIGIGRNSDMPGNYRLYVKNGILTERLKVAIVGTQQWADYVFAEDYSLMPLSEVEKFVSVNKHLPGIPSASEMVCNGLDVAEMDALLLKKIEELTLYVIELQKQLEAVKKEK